MNFPALTDFNTVGPLYTKGLCAYCLLYLEFLYTKAFYFYMKLKKMRRCIPGAPICPYVQIFFNFRIGLSTKVIVSFLLNVLLSYLVLSLICQKVQHGMECVQIFEHSSSLRKIANYQRVWVCHLKIFLPCKDVFSDLDDSAVEKMQTRSCRNITCDRARPWRALFEGALH